MRRCVVAVQDLRAQRIVQIEMIDRCHRNPHHLPHLFDWQF